MLTLGDLYRIAKCIRSHSCDVEDATYHLNLNEVSGPEIPSRRSPPSSREWAVSTNRIIFAVVEWFFSDHLFRLLLRYLWKKSDPWPYKEIRANKSQLSSGNCEAGPTVVLCTNIAVQYIGWSRKLLLVNVSMLIDWLIGFRTLVDCCNPARSHKGKLNAWKDKHLNVYIYRSKSTTINSQTTANAEKRRIIPICPTTASVVVRESRRRRKPIKFMGGVLGHKRSEEKWSPTRSEETSIPRSAPLVYNAPSILPSRIVYVRSRINMVTPSSRCCHIILSCGFQMTCWCHFGLVSNKKNCPHLHTREPLSHPLHFCFGLSVPFGMELRPCLPQHNESSLFFSRWR